MVVAIHTLQNIYLSGIAVAVPDQQQLRLPAPTPQSVQGGGSDHKSG